jgi:thioredoxin reductase
MKDYYIFDAIIVGGSYAGLSAALALGRSLRNVLILDHGLPCNRQTPEAHNFLTHDGKKPQAIRDEALQQVLAYPSVKLQVGKVTRATPADDHFHLITEQGEHFYAKRILLATGIKDLLPPIPGFAACWGISILHCPYCHGYEVRGEPTAILAHGPKALHMARLLQHWTNDLRVLTNGTALLTEEAEQLAEIGVPFREDPIEQLAEVNGRLQSIHFQGGDQLDIAVAYAHVPFQQQGELVSQLGCTLAEQGLLQVDLFQRTSVPGVFAAGDNASPMRAIAVAVASGMAAGAVINMDLIGGLLPAVVVE